MDWDDFKKTTKKLNKEDKEQKVCEVQPYEVGSKRGIFYIREKTLIKYSALTHIFIQSRIDLHGMTLDRAFESLRKFIFSSTNLMYVLVITGKGNPDSHHTIKKMVPVWLEDLPVKGYMTSPRNLGGEGALVVKMN